MKARQTVAPAVISGLLLAGVILALALPILRTIYATEIHSWWLGVLERIGVPWPLYYAAAVPLSAALLRWRFKR